MKLIILLLLGISLCIDINDRRRQIVEIVNKMNTTWKAEYYGNDFKTYYGVDDTYIIDDMEPKEFSNEINDLPKEYDLRKIYPKCETLLEIRDQANCGGCWAFAAVEVMSDRICIKSKGKLQTRVSAQNVISCCRYCGRGCHGGRPESAFVYWRTNGV